MNPSPYRSADDRFPYLAHLKVGAEEFDFMMVSERSEGWYGKGEDHHDYLSLIKPGDTVVDAGANEGYTAILSALKTGKTGQVIAFEPAKHNQGPLLINIAINNLVSRISLYPVGLSEITGDIPFSGEAVDKLYDSSCMGKASMVALDDFKLWDVDVLKIDVEGYEMKALRGAVETIAKFRPAIMVELHLSAPTGPDMRNYGDNPEDLLAFCKGAGYSIWRDGQPMTELSSGVAVLKPL